MIRRASLSIVAMSAAATAQPSDKPRSAVAQARLEAGTQAFVANEFVEASKQFAAGYAAEPWSGFLFAWAQSERRRGDCPSAVKLYTRFIATRPPAEVRQLADDAIAACGGTTEPTPIPAPIPAPIEPAPEPRPPSPPTTPPITPPVARDVERPFTHKLAIGLAAGSVVVGGVGVGFFVASRRAAEDAERAGSHPEVVALYGRARDHRLVAQICGGASLALAAAAVIRFVTNRESDDRVQVTAGPSTISFSARW